MQRNLADMLVFSVLATAFVVLLYPVAAALPRWAAAGAGAAALGALVIPVTLLGLVLAHMRGKGDGE